jgi:hypothetical protein
MILKLNEAFNSNYSNASQKFDYKKKIDLFHQDSKNGFQEDAQLKARFLMLEMNKNL